MVGLSGVVGVHTDTDVETVPATVDEYIAGLVAAQPTHDPPFLRAAPYEAILAENVRERNGRVDSHGVEYVSVERTALSDFHYPVYGRDRLRPPQRAPDRADTESVPRPAAGRPPPLGAADVPPAVRPGPADGDRARPRTGSDPRAATGVPLACSKPVHVAGEYWGDLFAKSDRFPASYRSRGPWQDTDELIRAHGFVGRALDADRDRIGRAPRLDGEAVEETHRAHRAGEGDYGQELYRPVTVLETPFAGRILDP